MNIKPLLRWTFGGANLHKRAFNILNLSVKNAIKIYGERFDYIICYNGLNDNQIDEIKSLGIELRYQHPFINGIGNKRRNTLWKHCPPRLRPLAHELQIDSDVVLEKELPEIEMFLQRDNHFLVAEGNTNSYGIFKNEISHHLQLNAGIFGVPPYFDMQKIILNKLKNNKRIGNLRPCGEQGLSVTIATQNPFITIPITTITLSYYDEPLQRGSCGTHFIGANYAKNHRGWSRYLKITNIIQIPQFL